MLFRVMFGEDQKVDQEMQMMATNHLNALANGLLAMNAMLEKGESLWDPEKPGATISIKLLAL